MILWQKEGQLDDEKYEDGGMAQISDFIPDNECDKETGFFLRFQSWSFDCEKEENDPSSHAFFDSLIGKNLRVTIEEI